MVKVSVTPDTFEMVEFDAGEIAAIAEEMAALCKLSDDTEVVIEVDEVAMMPNADSEIDGNRLVLKVTGGALEDQRKARTMSADRAKLVLGTYFMRAKDRMDPAWADAPPNDQLTVQQSSAWDTYTEGRLGRIGLPTRRPRRIYHFRLRHGFSDEIDAVFDRLWNADDLTWADIQAACEETKAAKEKLAVIPT